MYGAACKLFKFDANGFCKKILCSYWNIPGNTIVQLENLYNFRMFI